MNRLTRQQRRQLERNGIDPGTYSRLVDDIKQDAINFVFEQYGAVVALCLKDKLGFGKVRAQRFMSHVSEVFDAIEEDYLTLDDVMETVEKELGLNFR